MTDHSCLVNGYPSLLLLLDHIYCSCKCVNKQMQNLKLGKPACVHAHNMNTFKPVMLGTTSQLVMEDT